MKMQMLSKDLAETLKVKRVVVRFAAQPKVGRHPKWWTERVGELYSALEEMGAVTVEELLRASEKLRKLYAIRGLVRVPHSYQDVKRELCWLVDGGFATWSLVDAAPMKGATIRPPAEHEVAHGRRGGEEAWVKSGVMLESAEEAYRPYRLNNVIFFRGEKPNGNSKVARLWACLPSTHHVRLEDVEVDDEVRSMFPTPGDVFDGLMDLHRRGCVEVRPIGL